MGNSGTILSSGDGVNWTNRVSGTSHFLSGINYSSNSFVAVGEAGTILESSSLNLTPPTLGAIVLLSNGVAQITLTGTAGQRYRIDASSGLNTWTLITNVVLAAASGQFSDTAATNFSRRFYRAVISVP